MSSESMGTKRKCPICGKKFYDLGNTDPNCPTCGTEPLQPPSSQDSEDTASRSLVRLPNNLRPHKDQIIDHFIIRRRPSQARTLSQREAIIRAIQQAMTVRAALELRVDAPGFAPKKITMSDIHHCLENDYIAISTEQPLS